MPKILVVDDNPAIRSLLDVVLSGEGYRVRSAPNGPAALASAAADSPDLVVLDLRMPGMEGEEVLHALKELDPQVPVFFLTAFGDFPDRAALEEADCCFVKSSDLAPLLETIAYACNPEEAHPPCRNRTGLAAKGTCWRSVPRLASP